MDDENQEGGSFLGSVFGFAAKAWGYMKVEDGGRAVINYDRAVKAAVKDEFGVTGRKVTRAMKKEVLAKGLVKDVGWNVNIAPFSQGADTGGLLSIEKAYNGQQISNEMIVNSFKHNNRAYMDQLSAAGFSDDEVKILKDFANSKNSESWMSTHLGTDYLTSEGDDLVESILKSKKGTSSSVVSKTSTKGATQAVSSGAEDIIQYSKLKESYRASEARGLNRANGIKPASDPGTFRGKAVSKKLFSEKVITQNTVKPASKVLSPKEQALEAVKIIEDRGTEAWRTKPHIAYEVDELKKASSYIINSSDKMSAKEYSESLLHKKWGDYDPSNKAEKEAYKKAKKAFNKIPANEKGPSFDHTKMYTRDEAQKLAGEYQKNVINPLLNDNPEYKAIKESLNQNAKEYAEHKAAIKGATEKAKELAGDNFSKGTTITENFLGSNTIEIDTPELKAKQEIFEKENKKKLKKERNQNRRAEKKLEKTATKEATETGTEKISEARKKYLSEGQKAKTNTGKAVEKNVAKEVTENTGKTGGKKATEEAAKKVTNSAKEIAKANKNYLTEGQKASVYEKKVTHYQSRLLEEFAEYGDDAIKGLSETDDAAKIISQVKNYHLSEVERLNSSAWMKVDSATGETLEETTKRLFNENVDNVSRNLDKEIFTPGKGKRYYGYDGAKVQAQHHRNQQASVKRVAEKKGIGVGKDSTIVDDVAKGVGDKVDDVAKATGKAAEKTATASADDVSRILSKTDDAGNLLIRKVKPSVGQIVNKGVGVVHNFTKYAQKAAQTPGKKGAFLRGAGVVGRVGLKYGAIGLNAWMAWDIVRLSGNLIINTYKNSDSYREKEEKHAMVRSKLTYEQMSSFNDSVLSARVSNDNNINEERELVSRSIAAGKNVNEYMKVALGGYSDVLSVNKIRKSGR